MSTQEEIKFTKRKFLVFGTCLLPVQCELIVESDSALAAAIEAENGVWQRGIKLETANLNSAFDWELFVKEVTP